jgi:hypothetical protein
VPLADGFQCNRRAFEIEGRGVDSGDQARSVIVRKGLIQM